MRIALAALLAISLPLATRAEPNPACAYVAEALENTADILVMARDGDVSRNAILYLADAHRRAADEMRSGEWTGKAIDAADASFALATGRHAGGFTAADAATLLALGDTIAAESIATCGGDLPVFVRPGQGDARACAQILRLLRTVEQLLPAISGSPDTKYTKPSILMAVSEAGRAKNQAIAAQWSAETIAAIDRIATDGRGLATGLAEPGPGAGEKFVADVRRIADEGRDVCGVYDFRNITLGAG